MKRTVRQRRGTWHVAGNRAWNLSGEKSLSYPGGFIKNNRGQRNGSWVRRQKSNGGIGCCRKADTGSYLTWEGNDSKDY